MRLRNLIRLTVALAALAALVLAAVDFHTRGEIHTAGNLARVSGVVLALVIASLALEVSRALDGLAVSSASQTAVSLGYGDQIERDADRVQRMCTAGQVLACLILLPTAVLAWYFDKSITEWIFGTADTRFMVMAYYRGFVGVVYGWSLLIALQLSRYVSLIVLAKGYPLAATLVASREKAVIKQRYSMSCTAYFRLVTAFLAVCLLLGLMFTASYARFTDRGIGVVYFPGATEVFHRWNEVRSITESRSFGRGHKPIHGYAIQFSDGSEWRYDWIYDNSSHVLRPDPRAAIVFAANRAKLPFPQ